MRSQARLATAGLAVTLTVSACAASGSFSGSPPWVVCGNTLVDSAAGESVEDVSGRQSSITVSSVSVVGIGLLASHDCRHGATLTIEPNTAATVLRTATAIDHKTAAAIIDPEQAVFDVIVRHADGTITTVHVDLGPDFTPTPR